AQADAINQAIRLLSLRHRARAATLLAPLGLHPGQEALLLELARSGPMIQAQLSDALGCEPPSVTLMTRKLEASGHVRRGPAPSDKRASVVELTDRGKALADQVKRLWCGLAEETVAGLPAQTVAELPSILGSLTSNVDARRARRLAFAPGLPEHVAVPGIRLTAQDEQQVREPVQVFGGQRADRVAVLLDRRPGAAFGPPRHGPGHVQQRRPRRSARQQEAPEHRQILVERVALVLESLDIRLVDPQRRIRRRLGGDRVRQVGAHVEQLVLHPGEHGVDLLRQLAE